MAALFESFEMTDDRCENHLFTKSNKGSYSLLTGMGSCAIIHTMTLSVVNIYQIHAVTDIADFDEVINCLEHYVNEYDHFKFW
ncbi:MAG: hypothetical protein IT249_13940 [Chitinophagaceae bacterium]|nr:hypothetical protein [Chitinophagaceae bacterium]